MSIQTSLLGLTGFNQWVLWKPVKKSNGKTDKLPINARTYKVCDPHNPENWTSFQGAVDVLRPGYGIGFVFTENDPFFFIDLDNCVDELGNWTPAAIALMNHFSGAAQMASSSGTGAHIIGSGKPVNPRHKCKFPGGFEAYTSGRFVAISNYPAVGSVLVELGDALNAFIGGETRQAPADVDEWTVEAAEGYTGPESDDELVERALGSTGSGAAQFGSRPTFKALWERDEDVLAEHYPSGDSVRAYDDSRADACLAADLAFWTGKNCERIERLMRSSAMARDKWDTHPSYLKRTITGAVGKCKRIYDIDKSLATQKGVFEGCVYIARGSKMYTPNGEILKREEFNGAYGGGVFWLSESSSTREAWKAALFADEPAVERVDRATFRPLRPPGEIFTENGLRVVNTFVPRFGKRVAGDVSPFLEHVRRLIPNDDDRDKYLSYLAACVQMYGRKFQFCTVLVGVEGNGKSFIRGALEYALGYDYCHEVNPNDISNTFNGWISGHLLFIIEELKTGGRYSVANVLKPIITNNRVALQQKGVDQITGENYGNFIIFSNDKDAVFKMRDDRRYCVFYAAQQTKNDMRRDGLTSDYFKKLFAWRDEGGGMAAIADYLWTRPINIAVFGRAPETSSTAEAIAMSMGPLEQWLLEAVESGEPGFRGDLIDRGAAMAYLKQMTGKAVTPRNLTEIITNLGYVLPVALQDGNRRIRLDDGREHTVYARIDSEAATVPSRAELKAIWEKIYKV